MEGKNKLTTVLFITSFILFAGSLYSLFKLKDVITQQNSAFPQISNQIDLKCTESNMVKTKIKI
jgi:hypothetical protein